MAKVFSARKVKTELLLNAKALDIPVGAAEAFAEKVTKNVEKSLKNKKIITEDDLSRAILKQLNIYNSDLAYVYENRDKII